jgi:hypothetical protein
VQNNKQQHNLQFLFPGGRKSFPKPTGRSKDVGSKRMQPVERRGLYQFHKVHYESRKPACWTEEELHTITQPPVTLQKKLAVITAYLTIAFASCFTGVGRSPNVRVSASSKTHIWEWPHLGVSHLPLSMSLKAAPSSVGGQNVQEQKKYPEFNKKNHSPAI